jgi:hypothetical protein
MQASVVDLHIVNFRSVKKTIFRVAGVQLTRYALSMRSHNREREHKERKNKAITRGFLGHIFHFGYLTVKSAAAVLS